MNSKQPLAVVAACCSNNYRHLQGSLWLLGCLLMAEQRDNYLAAVGETTKVASFLVATIKSRC